MYLMATPRTAAGTTWPGTSPLAINMHSVLTIPHMVLSGPKECSLRAQYGAVPMVNVIHPMLNDIYILSVWSGQHYYFSIFIFHA